MARDDMDNGQANEWTNVDSGGYYNPLADAMTAEVKNDPYIASGWAKGGSPDAAVHGGLDSGHVGSGAGGRGGGAAGAAGTGNGMGYAGGFDPADLILGTDGHSVYGYKRAYDPTTGKSSYETVLLGDGSTPAGQAAIAAASGIPAGAVDARFQQLKVQLAQQVRQGNQNQYGQVLGSMGNGQFLIENADGTRVVKSAADAANTPGITAPMLQQAENERLYNEYRGNEASFGNQTWNPTKLAAQTVNGQQIGSSGQSVFSGNPAYDFFMRPQSGPRFLGPPVQQGGAGITPQPLGGPTRLGLPSGGQGVTPQFQGGPQQAPPTPQGGIFPMPGSQGGPQGAPTSPITGQPLSSYAGQPPQFLGPPQQTPGGYGGTTPQFLGPPQQQGGQGVTPQFLGPPQQQGGQGVTPPQFQGGPTRLGPPSGYGGASTQQNTNPLTSGGSSLTQPSGGSGAMPTVGPGGRATSGTSGSGGSGTGGIFPLPKAPDATTGGSSGGSNTISALKQPQTYDQGTNFSIPDDMTNWQANNLDTQLRQAQEFGAVNKYQHLTAGPDGSYSGTDFFGNHVNLTADQLANSGSATAAEQQGMQQDYSQQQRQFGLQMRMAKSQDLTGYDPNQVGSSIAGVH